VGTVTGQYELGKKTGTTKKAVFFVSTGKRERKISGRRARRVNNDGIIEERNNIQAHQNSHSSHPPHN